MNKNNSLIQEVFPPKQQLHLKKVQGLSFLFDTRPVSIEECELKLSSFFAPPPLVFWFPCSTSSQKS